MAQALADFDRWIPDTELRAQLLLQPSGDAKAFDFAHDLIHTVEKPLVIIVEHDADARARLVDLLQTSNNRVTAFETAGEMLVTDLRDRPGCFIIDVQLAGLNALDLYEHLNACGLSQPVIFLSGHSDTALTVRAMKAGAVDFLLKPVSDLTLLNAVACAIALDLEHRDTAQQLRIQAERVAALTPREYQVMRGVTFGRLNKQIAYDLGISEITVKVHRGNLMRKLCARSVCDLVRTWDMLTPRPNAIAVSAC